MRREWAQEQGDERERADEDWNQETTDDVHHHHYDEVFLREEEMPSFLSQKRDDMQPTCLCVCAELKAVTHTRTRSTFNSFSPQFSG